MRVVHDFFKDVRSRRYKVAMNRRNHSGIACLNLPHQSFKVNVMILHFHIADHVHEGDNEFSFCQESKSFRGTLAFEVIIDKKKTQESSTKIRKIRLTSIRVLSITAMKLVITT